MCCSWPCFLFQSMLSDNRLQEYSLFVLCTRQVISYFNRMCTVFRIFRVYWRFSLLCSIRLLFEHNCDHFLLEILSAAKSYYRVCLFLNLWLNTLPSDQYCLLTIYFCVSLIRISMCFLTIQQSFLIIHDLLTRWPHAFCRCFSRSSLLLLFHLVFCFLLPLLIYLCSFKRYYQSSAQLCTMFLWPWYFVRISWKLFAIILISFQVFLILSLTFFRQLFYSIV